jgi:hypothetical protein
MPRPPSISALILLAWLAGCAETGRNPVAFWLSAIALALMGLYLLAVALGPTFPWLAGPEL